MGSRANNTAILWYLTNGELLNNSFEIITKSQKTLNNAGDYYPLLAITGNNPSNLYIITNDFSLDTFNHHLLTL